MKTRLMIEIETPDDMKVINADGEVSKEEAEEFCKEWHMDLVKVFKNIETKIKKDWMEEIETYYDEDGELPAFTLTINKVDEE